MAVRFSVARVEAGQWLDITDSVHAPVLEEHVKERREKRAELRRAMSIRALPGGIIKGLWALRTSTNHVRPYSPLAFPHHPLHMAHGFVVENEGNGVQKETAEEIAMEEEKLKNDSAEDVRRQLEQQHVAESEEKAVQGVKHVADKCSA
ncbi:hypothetical protein EDD15DRAFT_2362693 [Pisolithus albus]|nr:hypothetical protein EDD15DRAFT_2362693 [Pisolithus albus]